MSTESRNYPAIEEVFGNGSLDAFLEKCSETCRQLDVLAHGPDSRLAERAKSAMTAYGHTLALLEQLSQEASATAASQAR